MVNGSKSLKNQEESLSEMHHGTFEASTFSDSGSVKSEKTYLETHNHTNDENLPQYTEYDHENPRLMSEQPAPLAATETSTSNASTQISCSDQLHGMKLSESSQSVNESKPCKFKQFAKYFRSMSSGGCCNRSSSNCKRERRRKHCESLKSRMHTTNVMRSGQAPVM